MTPSIATYRVRKPIAALAMVLCLAGAAAVALLDGTGNQPQKAAAQQPSKGQAAAPDQGPGLSGRVFALDAKGLPAGPVANARIEFKDQSGQPAGKATTNSLGRYTVKLTPGTYYYKVTAEGFKDEDGRRGIQLARSRGYAVYNFSLVKGKNDPNKKPPDILPVKIGGLQGRVLEQKADGKTVGIPGAKIMLLKTDEPPKTEGGAKLIPVTSGGGSGDQAGHYGEVRLPAGAYRASVAVIGFEVLVDPDPKADPNTIAIAADQHVTHDFVLKRRKPPEVHKGGIKGVVTAYDREGKVAAQLPVQVTIKADLWSPVGAALPDIGYYPVNPDAQGKYTCERSPGNYRVVADVKAEGYQITGGGPAHVFEGKYTTVHFVLRPRPAPLTFEATVSDTAKQPLAGVTVLLRKPGQSARGALRGVTAERGKVSLKPTAPGEYEVFAYKSGYKSASAAVKIARAADNRAELTLEKETVAAKATLTVQVLERGPSGKGVPGARVVVRKAGTIVNDAKADADGRLQIPLLPADYTVSAEQTGYQPGSTAVQLSGETLAKVFLVPSPKLIVHVMEAGKDSQGAPVSGARVVVRNKAGQEVAGGRTGADGIYNVLLSTDHVQVEVSKEGYKTVQPKSADLTTGSARVDFFLGRKDAHPWTLTVKVVERDNLKPVPDAQVIVKPGGETVTQVAPGQYAAHLPAGTHEVVVRKDRYKDTTLQVTLSNQDVSRTVLLRKSELAPADVEVPNVIGMSMREAGATLRGKGLVMKPIFGPNSVNAKEQYPAAGTMVRQGATVTVVFPQVPPGKGVTVPDVKGMTFSQAQAALKAHELQLTARGDTRTGKATSQSPAANNKVAKGSSVTVTFTALSDTQVTVPDVKGMTFSQALAALKAHELQLTARGDTRIGKASSQSPAANSEVAKGSSVTVTFTQGGVKPPPTGKASLQVHVTRTVQDPDRPRKEVSVANATVSVSHDGHLVTTAQTDAGGNHAFQLDRLDGYTVTVSWTDPRGRVSMGQGIGNLSQGDRQVPIHLSP